MLKTVKVTGLKVGDKLVAWHGAPRVISKVFVENGWHKVKTDRGPIAIGHASDVAHGNVYVAIER